MWLTDIDNIVSLNTFATSIGFYNFSINAPSIYMGAYLPLTRIAYACKLVSPYPLKPWFVLDISLPWYQSPWGQHGANLGPTGSRLAPLTLLSGYGSGPARVYKCIMCHFQCFNELYVRYSYQLGIMRYLVVRNLEWIEDYPYEIVKNSIWNDLS